jgi:hypothetical protein
VEIWQNPARVRFRNSKTVTCSPSIARTCKPHHPASAQLLQNAVVGNRAADNGLGIIHFPRILRPSLDNCRELGWLLKNSLSENSQKLLRVRKLYKRFSQVA